MTSVNKVTLIGRMGTDPELKQAGGAVLCTFRMATSENKLGPDNQWTEETEWHTVKVWGESANSLARRAKKGTMICVEGPLVSNMYQERRYWEIKSRRWKILVDGIKREDQGGGGGYQLLPPEKQNQWSQQAQPKSPWG